MTRTMMMMKAMIGMGMMSRCNHDGMEKRRVNRRPG